jgi:DNA mismatch repair protein MutS
MPTDDVTPVRQQYLDTKRQYPDCILLFRLGDFYETFDEDAETVSRELDIVLTSRPVGKGLRAPLAGIPYHALDNYLVRLIEKGYHVAIAEQVGDQPAKGIFPRKVVRVVTPGTLIEPSLLPGDANNYLAAVVLDSSTGEQAPKAAVAYADITTGEFAVTELDYADGAPLRAELTRLRPAEIIHPDNITLPNGAGGHTTAIPAWRFEPGRSTESLLKHFNTSTLEGFGLKNAPLAVRAAGAILQYLKETEPASLALLTSLRHYSLNEFMTLDASTRRNLELTETLRGEIKGSLLGVLDDTVTPMGKRLLRTWVSQPLLDLPKIENRQNGVGFFFSSGMLRAELRAALKPLADLERLTNRILSGHAQPRDLVALRETLKRIPAILAVLPQGAAPIQATLSLLSPCSEALSLLEAAIADDPPATTQNTGMIRPGYSAELDGVIDASAHARDWINNLEAIERERTGIKTLKVGYNKVFGYYLEISAGQAANAPKDYIRKQTLVNAERYITPEMKEYETLVLNAEERIREIELRLFKETCAALSKATSQLLNTARALAELDCLAALAEAAALNGYTRPEVVTEDVLEVIDGRHAVVENLLKGERYVPNDIIFEPGERVRIITGPNMSGKCVTGDTLIWTGNGLQRMDDLMPIHALEGEFSALEIHVQGQNEIKKTSHFYRGGAQKTLRIRTVLGYEIEGTPEHPVWVRTDDENEKWKPLGELSVDDAIILVPGANLWGNKTEINFVKPPKQGGSYKTYPLPDTMNPSLAYIMGLLVGDGTLTYTNALTLSTADEFIATTFQQVFAEQFNYQVQEKTNGKDWSITSKEIRAYFGHLGLNYVNALKKSIPVSILAAPKEIMTAFLQGLFDTDGYADTKYGNVTLSTSSNQMAAQVQAVLLNFGIIGSLHSKPTKVHMNYLVDISGENAIKFHREIGFRLPRKQERAKLASAKRMPNIGGIPRLEKTLKTIQARIVATPNKPVALKRNKRINSIFYTYLPTHRRLSYAKLTELLAYCLENGVPAPEIAGILQNHYFYDRITSIEPGEAEVFDLTVPDGHAFLANGFLSHNSTYLRESAIITLMAQMGSFVPAASAKIGLVDRIFTRIGAQDEIHAGQSTFMVEMIETANILHHATPRSLLILDEIGRGTSTYDGVSIAWAVVEHLHNHPHLRAKTLFATHYHELTQLADLLPGVRNYNVAVTEAEGSVVFLHKIIPGGADRSYGIHVAQLAGLPRPVIQRASEIMAELEKTSGRAVKLNPVAAQQVALFPETNPLLEELKTVDVNALSPIEALNKLFEWQKKFLQQ